MNNKETEAEKMRRELFEKEVREKGVYCFRWVSYKGVDYWDHGDYLLKWPKEDERKLMTQAELDALCKHGS